MFARSIAFMKQPLPDVLPVVLLPVGGREDEVGRLLQRRAVEVDARARRGARACRSTTRTPASVFDSRDGQRAFRDVHVPALERKRLVDPEAGTGERREQRSAAAAEQRPSLGLLSAASSSVMSCSGSTHGRRGLVPFTRRRFPAAGFAGISSYSTASERICESRVSVLFIVFAESTPSRELRGLVAVDLAAS